MMQQRKEGGRGGRADTADRCHCRRRTTRRRKANKGAHTAATKTTATVEEDEAKTIAAIDVGRMNNGADDPDTNKDSYDVDGDGNDNGVAMLANGTEVARHDVDAASKQGMCAGPHCIVLLLIN